MRLGEFLKEKGSTAGHGLFCVFLSGSLALIQGSNEVYGIRDQHYFEAQGSHRRYVLGSGIRLLI